MTLIASVQRRYNSPSQQSNHASGAPAGGSVVFITVLFTTLPKSKPPLAQIKRTYSSQCMRVTSFASISRSSRF